MQCASLLLILCLGLQTGTVVNAGEQEECALAFYMFGSQQERVVFTGLTAEELARRDTTTTGHKLTCACVDTTGLKPLEWLDWNKVALPDSDKKQLVDYKAAGSQPGSAVNLRINKNTFSCAEAGEYTCVVGTNNRTVLVTPSGVECGPANVTITASPAGPVSIGTDLTLECSAEDPTGSGLTYQWLRKGTLISGELSPTLMVTVMGPQEGGTYTCCVRNRVGQGEANVTVEVIVVTSSTPMVTSSTPVVTSSTPVVTSSTPMVTSSTPVVTPSTPMVTSSTPVVTFSTPMVTSSTPMVTSGTPVVTSNTPMVTSRPPMVTSSTPMVTFSTPVVIMVEPSSTPTEPLPASGSVRLVDGTGPHEGRVEIFYNNTWGTVCDNDWSINDGLVVCHQLGYPGLLRVYREAHFGEGTGPILLDNLICTGTEENLTQCPNGEVNCHHSEDAGVTCARESVSSSSTIVRSSFEELTASTSALPSTDFMLPSTQDVQSTLTVLSPSTPVIESSPSDVDASTPVVTPSIPVITPSPSDVAPSTPVITSTSSVADSTSAVVTPSSTSTRPSTSPTPGPTVNVQTPTGVIVNTSRVTGGAVQITLMWSKPGNDSGLTGYQIQYSWESKWDPSRFVKRQSERKTMSVNVTDTSHMLQDAEGFAEYCFAVSALYEGGEKSPATAEQCTTTPETKPSPPLHLRQVHSSVTSSSVRLQWDAPDPPNGNITHFKVYYQQGSSRQYQVSDWQGQRFVVLDGLDPDTEYYVNVTAVTDTLESDASNGLRVVTLPVTEPSKPVVTPSTPVITAAVADSATPEVTPSFATVSSSAQPSTSPTPSPSVDPQTPMGMTVNHSTTDDEKVDITLMWSKPGNDSGLTGYQIQYSWESKWDPRRFVKRQSERKTMSVNVTNTSHTLKDVEGFAEYCFAVSALYEGGEESNATAKRCTTTPETKPSPPQNLRQVDSFVTTSSVRLQWDAPDPPNGNITHFKVYYQQGSSRPYQVSDWQGQGYLVLDGLDPDTEYYVNVTAVTDKFESDGSNGLRVVTLPVAALDTPMDMSVNHSTTDDEKVDITLMWSKPGNDSGLTGYQIQYSWESKWDPSRFVKRQSERKTMSVNVTNTSHTLKDVEGFAEYCFAVSALYEGGEESNATAKRCITTPETKPSPPLNLRQVHSSVTTSSVRLQWDAPDPPNGNITHFKVYYQQGSSRQYQVSDWQGQGYVVLDRLDPNTKYYVNVTAVTDTFESDASNGLRVVTLHVAALAASATGTPGWVVAVIVIIILLILIICIIVVAVVLCCVLAKRAGKYDVPAAEKTSKVNYVYEMEEEEGSKKEEVDEQSPVLVTAT